MKRLSMIMMGLLVAAAAPAALAGPYATGGDDPANPHDPGVPGWTGPVGDPGSVVNPAFDGWVIAVVDYVWADYVDPEWTDTSYALGPAVGDGYDVVCLGDMDAGQIAGHLAAPEDPAIVHPGFITLTFDGPVFDGPGADFAVFENGFTEVGTGGFFAELAYVEVSTDNATFVRFPSRSLTAAPEVELYAYWTLDPTDVYNLAGKHANRGGMCMGTPFDLAELAADPAVIDGAVDLFDIRYVRIVDIPGSGDFVDSWGDPIYDAWRTAGTGGFDLDAVGVLHMDPIAGDADCDGDVDLDDFIILKNGFGVGTTWGQGDFDHDGDVDLDDFFLLKANFGFGAVAAGGGLSLPW